MSAPRPLTGQLDQTIEPVAGDRITPPLAVIQNPDNPAHGVVVVEITAAAGSAFRI